MTLRARILGLAATLSLVVAPLSGGTAEAKPSPAKPVTVMTRNLYLGADINRPVEAALTAQAQGKTPQEIVVALANATHVTRAIVDQTNFPVRAQLLAGEITRTEPDLIGLQEVALWRSGPLQLEQVGVPNATTVDYDFLQILLDALAARGEQYTAVSIGNRADVEAPSFTGSPFDGTMGADARDVRLTMRDVVLMHVEDGLSATGTGNAIYAHNLSITVGSYFPLRPRLPVGRRPGGCGEVPVRQHSPGGVQLRPRTCPGPGAVSERTGDRPDHRVRV